MTRNAIRVSSDKVASCPDTHCFFILAAEDEHSRAGIPDQQSAHYECVELKICSSDNRRIVEMKLQNMSNPELSVEGDHSVSLSKTCC